jgi:hypothetical protein
MPERKETFYEALKARHCHFSNTGIVSEFASVDRIRVQRMTERLAAYISKNLPAAFEGRESLGDYRTNPYVLMTTASVMRLDQPERFADFLFNTKLYMALETSFGKSIERIFLTEYPTGGNKRWQEPPEKRAEFDLLSGLTREQRAAQRTQSVWRELDASVISGKRRYLAAIKSGPNTINDTQVQAMTQAIIEHHPRWAERSRALDRRVEGVDIVLGLTYGTDRTTNNKENQILAKLLDNGFVEEDRRANPGVLVDKATSSVRVYRRIGKDFWSFIGNPARPGKANHVFLEVLMALAKALSTGVKAAHIEDRINRRIAHLSQALSNLRFPRNSLPDWVRNDFSEEELFWFATSMTAFYDEGI